ncbi:MAG: Subunit of heteropentameric Replication factor C (RF-C), partial [Paramarteilia canceri]
QSFLERKQLPHLLFYGSPGTGKTSAILALAHQLYGASKSAGMVLELNASDDRGINVVREEIMTFASSQGFFSSTHKLIILDEADSMTKDAQNSLRRVIESYTNNVRFCIICNYQTKIIPAIQSRCMKFRFGPLESEHISKRLCKILKSENCPYNEQGINAAVHLGNGDMRKTINIVESCFFSFGKVHEENVYLNCGKPTTKTVEAVLQLLLNADMADAFQEIISLKKSEGLALSDLVTSIFDVIHKYEIEQGRMAHLVQYLAELE